MAVRVLTAGAPQQEACCWLRVLAGEGCSVDPSTHALLMAARLHRGLHVSLPKAPLYTSCLGAMQGLGFSSPQGLGLGVYGF